MQNFSVHPPHFPKSQLWLPFNHRSSVEDEIEWRILGPPLVEFAASRAQTSPAAFIPQQVNKLHWRSQVEDHIFAVF